MKLQELQEVTICKECGCEISYQCYEEAPRFCNKCEEFRDFNKGGFEEYRNDNFLELLEV